MLNELFAEFIGTFLLILLGNGVVANVVLKDTKGNNGGWLLISMGWGLGVFVGVTVAGPVSGAHINPAVTLGLAVAGNFAWSQVIPFIAAQMAEQLPEPEPYGFSTATTLTVRRTVGHSWVVLQPDLPSENPSVILSLR